MPRCALYMFAAVPMDRSRRCVVVVMFEVAGEEEDSACQMAVRQRSALSRWVQQANALSAGHSGGPGSCVDVQARVRSGA